jgi:hypothetical protein
LIKVYADEFEEEWDQFKHSGDSVAMITWFAKRFNMWSGQRFLKMVRDDHAIEVVPDMSGRLGHVIKSPDGKTDWSTAVWWIHYQIDSTLPFTPDVLSRMEESLNESESATNI